MTCADPRLCAQHRLKRMFAFLWRPGSCLPLAEMLATSPTMPTAMDVVECVELIYEKHRATLASNGAVGALDRVCVWGTHGP